jgi:hypothetical protein
MTETPEGTAELPEEASFRGNLVNAATKAGLLPRKARPVRDQAD